MNCQRELEILTELSSKLNHPKCKDWLFPLYPEEYKVFSRKRNSKYCVGEHLLYIDEYTEDCDRDPEIFEKGEDVDKMKEFLENEDHSYASMQIHEIKVIGEDEVAMDIQTYGASFDCDHVYPTFKYHEKLGLWICYNGGDYPSPVILRFTHYNID